MDTGGLPLAKKIKTDLIPDIDCAYDIGTISKRFNEVHAKTIVADSLPVPALDTDLVPTTDETYNIGSPTHKWDQVWMRDLHFNEMQGPLEGTGLISGGSLGTEISVVEFSVSAGSYCFEDEGVVPPTRKLIDFPAQNNIPWPTAAGFTFSSVLIDVNGTITTNAGVVPTNSSHRNKILLGYLNHPSGFIITAVTPTPSVIRQTALQTHDLMRAIGSIKESGLVGAAVGGTLSVQSSTGCIHAVGVNFEIDELNPNSVQLAAKNPVPFLYLHQDGSPATAQVTVLDPDTYNPTGTTEATIPNNNWGIHVFYFFGGGAVLALQPQVVYPNKQAAVDGVGDSRTIPPNLTNAVLAFHVIVKKGETDLASGDTEFVQGGKFQGGSAVLGSAETSAAQLQTTGANVVVNNTIPTGAGEVLETTSAINAVWTKSPGSSTALTKVTAQTTATNTIEAIAGAITVTDTISAAGEILLIDEVNAGTVVSVPLVETEKINYWNTLAAPSFAMALTCVPTSNYTLELPQSAPSAGDILEHDGTRLTPLPNSYAFTAGFGHVANTNFFHAVYNAPAGWTANANATYFHFNGFIIPRDCTLIGMMSNGQLGTTHNWQLIVDAVQLLPVISCTNKTFTVVDLDLDQNENFQMRIYNTGDLPNQGTVTCYFKNR